MPDHGPVGGGGGSDFDDSTIGDMDQLEIIQIRVRAENSRFVNSIEVLYRNRLTGEHVQGDHHGGQGGTEHPPVTLEAGEFITEIEGGAGQFVDSLTFRTNLRFVGRFGGEGGHPYHLPESPIVSDTEVFAFFGRSGTLIDAIGIKTRPRLH
jgi:hypothetical protein